MAPAKAPPPTIAVVGLAPHCAARGLPWTSTMPVTTTAIKAQSTRTGSTGRKKARSTTATTRHRTRIVTLDVLRENRIRKTSARPDASPRRPSAGWSGGRHAVRRTSAGGLGRPTRLRLLDIQTSDNLVQNNHSHNYKEHHSIDSNPNPRHHKEHHCAPAHGHRCKNESVKHKYHRHHWHHHKEIFSDSDASSDSGTRRRHR
jgi:hypothetical protein